MSRSGVRLEAHGWPRAAAAVRSSSAGRAARKLRKKVCQLICHIIIIGDTYYIQLGGNTVLCSTLHRSFWLITSIFAAHYAVVRLNGKKAQVLLKARYINKCSTQTESQLNRVHLAFAGSTTAVMDRRIASPDYISQEMLRNALYGKWCDLNGRSLSADTNTKARQLLEKKKGKSYIYLFLIDIFLFA